MWIMHTVSIVSTILISTIRFTGIAGIMILITIIQVGRLLLAGDGDILIMAGDILIMAGVTHITAGVTRDMYGAITHLITGDIPDIIHLFM
jgi:hypothetical protein